MGRSLFPPVRQLSFQHNPDGKLAQSLRARDRELPCMPTISSSRTTHVLPSAGWQQKVHSSDPSMPLPKQKQSNLNSSKFLQRMAEGYLTNIQCCHGDFHPRSAQGVRKNSCSNHIMGLQNCNLPAVRHILPEGPKRRKNTYLIPKMINENIMINCIKCHAKI
ncbi:hypothetical protein UPYG_G00167170 [Umbra pygmaea]|uniref:Uncharacterized protein n=1 Tax=Umbra pygmaea TaxID=75934 RepID=A0ABD0XD53_UMBPY